MIQIAHLDVNVTIHCTNRCVGCSHASPFADEYFMASEVLERDLAALRPILQVGRIHIVGGEPLLHPNIDQMIEIAKRSMLAAKTSVITNGKLLGRMPVEFWSALEILQISVYADLNPKAIELARDAQKEFGFELGVTEFTEFYKQFTAPTDGVESFKNCIWRRDCFTVHGGCFYLCPQSAFFTPRFLNLPDGTDGLPLEGITEQKLRAFIDRQTPFKACTICRGYTEKTPWRQAKSEAEWIKESTV